MEKLDSITVHDILKSYPVILEVVKFGFFFFSFFFFLSVQDYWSIFFSTDLITIVRSEDA